MAHQNPQNPLPQMQNQNQNVPDAANRVRAFQQIMDGVQVVRNETLNLGQFVIDLGAQMEQLHGQMAQLQGQMEQLQGQVHQGFADVVLRMRNAQGSVDAPLCWLDVPGIGRPPMNAPCTAEDVTHRTSEPDIDALLGLYQLPVKGTFTEKKKVLRQHLGVWTSV